MPDLRLQADVEELFAQFLTDAESVILFLNHVEQIDVLVWEDGAAQPRMLNRIKVSGPDLVRFETGPDSQTLPLPLPPCCFCFSVIAAH